ncbi:hypothetical protein OAN24_06780, partial [Pseudodesulfovibrio sp.]|nr:hypothetical protein [Pseudodesulfovibrio sp.]
KSDLNFGTSKKYGLSSLRVLFKKIKVRSDEPKEIGWTLHSNRHERFHRMYVEHTGFQPPNQHSSVEAFQHAAQNTAGPEWPRLDAEARDDIEQTAGHSAGRRDVSDAYLGCSH